VFAAEVGVTASISPIAVVGAGAVGSFYGAMLARAGHRVTLIGRPAHVQAIERDGLQLQMAGRTEAVRLAASTELAAARDARLVLFCVKSTDSDTTARQLAAQLGPDALVLSLQNGVENAAILARHLTQTVVPAVVYVATSMPGPGRVAHHGRGDLVIGALNVAAAQDARVGTALQRIVELFATAQVPVRVSADVMAELWQKLMVNSAYNAISAVAQLPYGKLAALPEVRELQRAIVREVVAVATADGVTLPLEASLQAMEGIAPAMPAQMSSTAQDVARRKPSEIDHLNGFVSRRGRELQVATPVNDTLHALVKLIESGY
jgi:2-dehydropantoate 2-reductase